MAIVVGLAFGFKYAIDQGWLTSWMRVGLGWAAGLAAVAWGQVAAHRRDFRSFGHAVIAGGIALLYLSTLAGIVLYEILLVGMGVFLLTGIAAGGGLLALRNDSLPLMVMASVARVLARAGDRERPCPRASDLVVRRGARFRLGDCRVARLCGALGNRRTGGSVRAECGLDPLRHSDSVRGYRGAAEARTFALVLLAAVMTKLVALDLWLLPPLQRTASFVGLGAVLLVCSLMYHRLLPALLGEQGDEEPS